LDRPEAPISEVFVGIPSMEYLQFKSFVFARPNTDFSKGFYFDKAGNESNEVVFPFTFESGVRSPYPRQLPAPFDQGVIPRLGYIMIDLYGERI